MEGHDVRGRYYSTIFVIGAIRGVFQKFPQAKEAESTGVGVVSLREAHHRTDWI